MYDSVDKNNYVGGSNKLVWRELERFGPKEIMKKKGPIKVTKQTHFNVGPQRLNLFSKPFQTHTKAIRKAVCGRCTSFCTAITACSTSWGGLPHPKTGPACHPLKTTKRTQIRCNRLEDSLLLKSKAK
jgi:hypothetical protein